MSDSVVGHSGSSSVPLARCKVCDAPIQVEGWDVCCSLKCLRKVKLPIHTCPVCGSTAMDDPQAQSAGACSLQCARARDSGAEPHSVCRERLKSAEDIAKIRMHEANLLVKNVLAVRPTLIDRAARFIGGVNWQDHTVAEQREARDLLAALGAALGRKERP